MQSIPKSLLMPYLLLEQLQKFTQFSQFSWIGKTLSKIKNVMESKIMIIPCWFTQLWCLAIVTPQEESPDG